MVMSNTIIVARTGICTFCEKAIVASNDGALNILYLNNKVTQIKKEVYSKNWSCSPRHNLVLCDNL